MVTFTLIHFKSLTNTKYRTILQNIQDQKHGMQCRQGDGKINGDSISLFEQRCHSSNLEQNRYQETENDRINLQK